jgi:plastocyanin
LQKVEGNVAFHTALSTAFPQPRPGRAPSPGPMVVPAGQLGDVLGVRQVHYLPAHRQLAVVDQTLSGKSPESAFAAGEEAARARAAATPLSANKAEIAIANFAFSPRELTVKAGTTVTWRNNDDAPHRIQSSDNRFTASPPIDTKGSFSTAFADRGEYPYYCSIHPVMQGKIIVQP